MKKFLVLLILAFVSSGCAVHKATINAFTDPSFNGADYKKVAVFPMRNTKFAPSEAHQINRKIAQALSKTSPTLSIMGSSEAIDKLNERDLSDKWATFLERYTDSGVPNSDSLKEIGEALGVDGIVQGEIVRVIQSDGSYGSAKGTTRITVRYTLLDTRRGKLAWEASSDGTRVNAGTLADAPPIIEAVNLAVDKIAENLPQL